MSSSTGSGGVLGQRSARETKAVVERDGGGEREEAAGQSGPEAVQGAGAVAFEGEDVFGGPVDRLDPLADRREVQALAGLVFAAWAMDRDVEGGEVGFEPLAAEVLVADLRNWPGCRLQRATSCRQTSFSSTFGEVNAIALGVPSIANRVCSRKP